MASGASWRNQAPLSRAWISSLQTKNLAALTPIGCTSLPDPAPSSSNYVSTRIQSIMESRSEFGSNLEIEIEESRVHRSEMQSDSDEKYSAEKNLELYRTLQNQHGGPKGFFSDWDDEVWALEEKIGEGAQGEIYTLRLLRPEHAYHNGRLVMKVFKKGTSLEDLQKQWPHGMLVQDNTSKNENCWNEGSVGIAGGMMLENGRFAFMMHRHWGDLRKLIDLRMVRNSNQAPPFTDYMALMLMCGIAWGMRGLHKDNIVHRDLKASNVLIGFPLYVSRVDFDPTSDDNFFVPYVADYECSVGVVGTGFWRAPEILLAIMNHDIQPSIFTTKSDVCSYAMTCYEIFTGQIPFEGERTNNFVVLTKLHSVTLT